MQLSRSDKTWIGLAALAFVFQLTTLNYPKMNGDEGIYVLILEQFALLRGGHWPAINPVIGYSGPLHFWLIGSIYGLTAAIPSLKPGPWMVRIVPLALFWAGLLSIVRELGKAKEPESRQNAFWYLGVGAVMPMTLVFSRVTFPHSILLASALLFMAEALRLRRTGKVRWFRAGLWAALLVDTHPTGYLALAAIGVLYLPEVLREARKEPLKALGCVSLFGASCYSALRNFPLPIEGVGKSSFFLQARAVANVNTGIQTYDFWFAHDLAPNALLAIFLSFLLFCCFNQLKELIKSKERGDRQLLWLLGVQVAMTLLIMRMAMNGRHLFFKGCERYLLCLIPGWILLQGDAYRRFARAYLPTDLARAAFAVLIGVFFLSRPMLLTFDLFGDQDPYRLDAEWLMKECPKGECVAYAEDFWSYWPIRFYSRDGMDLNFVVDQWKEVATYPALGKRLAGCWHSGSKRMPQGTYLHRLTIPAQDLESGEECLVGLDESSMSRR